MKTVFAFVALLAMPVLALAGKVSIESVKAEVYDVLPAFAQNSERGLLTRSLVPPEGKAFLSVTASLKVEWDEKTTEVTLDPKKTGLFDDATQLSSVGMFSYTGIFFDYSPSPILRRPWDYKPGQPAKPTVYHRIFLIPRGAKSLTLRFEDVEAPVAVPEKPVKVDFASLVDVTIEKAELKDAVEIKSRNGLTTSAYANPGGKVLAVNVKVTPKAGNVPDDPDRFVWMDEWLALDLGKGNRLACCGGDFMNGISFVPKNPNRGSPDRPWPTSSKRVYFAVPADFTEATLTWLLAPVAKIEAK